MDSEDIAKLLKSMISPEGLRPIPTDVAQEFREKALRNLVQNPILRQYQQHIDNPARATNNEPWHALGERYYAAVILFAASMNEEVQVIGLGPKAPRESMLVSLALIVMQSTPYLWSDAMEKLADAAPLPKHIVSRDVMPHPVMFWSRETAYRIPAANGLFPEGENNWMALFNAGHQMVIVGDFAGVEYEPIREVKDLKILIQSLPFGQRWPDDYGNTGGSVDRVLKRCAFLASPYIESKGQGLARHHRRQMERAGLEPPEERIHVVKLRRSLSEPTGATRDHGEIEWQHQWWVSGHYRAQWYPSKGEHKVIWLAPYLKGPTDKPVLEKIYAVLR